MKTIIEKITSVRKGECLVTLRGMRADLTDCIRVRLDDIHTWFGVDSAGHSVEYELKAGVTIFFDTIDSRTRSMINPRFTD